MKCELSQVVDVVAGFVARTRALPKSTVSAQTRILEEGLVDSFALIELIGELEATFKASIPEGELIPQDFETPTVLFHRLQKL